MFGIIGAMESEITLLKNRIEGLAEHRYGKSVFLLEELKGRKLCS